MQIGAIGWWSYDNQGDLAMLAALRAGLSPHHVVPLDVGFSAQPDVISRLNRFDYVILGGGTLIPGKPVPPFDTFDAWKDQLDTPLGVVGLGVDPLIESYRPAIDALIDYAQFFFVRDHASFQLLDRPKVQVAPDLTFAYPLHVVKNAAEQRERPVCGVNIRNSSTLDPRLWSDIIARLPVEIRAIPLSSFESFDENALLRQLDPRCAQTYSPNLYAGLDLMIGVAFHSVVFAVQAGIPVIAIAYAPKVHHFMEEIGLGQYVLSTDAWGELPELVDEVLVARSQVAQQLSPIRDDLHQQAQSMFRSVIRAIGQSAPRHRQTEALVTVVVMGTGNAEKEERTIASCLAQTYANLEILFAPLEESSAMPPAVNDIRVVRVAPGISNGDRLQRALAEAQGRYVTWLDGGDWLAEDALDCLVERLVQDPGCDVLYADYWLVSEQSIPVVIQRVLEVGKLYRRDVVGPCFLVRKEVLNSLSAFPVDAPLPAYSMWLQLSSTGRFSAFHAPLLYSARQPRSPDIVVRERVTRQMWRKNLPGWLKALWYTLDSDFGEQYIMQPVAYLNRLLRSIIHAER